MKALFSFAIAMVLAFNIQSQPGWTWEVLPNMPEPVANNAVVEALSNDTLCVYSFCGIDSTLESSGIHLKTFKYNTVSQVWSQLADAPDDMGKIAAGASYVNGVIYLIGGYYVFENDSELSSEKVHRFDPNTDSWMTDAADIPLAIDDHVQVEKDQYIYVVTGWSDNQNVPDVQVYNTETDEWFQGTNTPNNGLYKAFGASGEIIGNTIYYHGGVNGVFSFNANSRMRRGIISEVDPLDIDWDNLDDSPGADGYRAAAFKYEERIFWLGGGGVAYNYDALAYDGSGGVEPEPRILTYYAATDIFEDAYGSPYSVMDLRGIGQLSTTEWIICGGIGNNQETLNTTYKISYDPSVGVEEEAENNLEYDIRSGVMILANEEMVTASVLDFQGRLLWNSEVAVNQIPLSSYDHPIAVQIRRADGTVQTIKLFLN
ncbi:MAG: hypothetical protein HRT74_01265 [Flavobacteriales bacterium]|nr:hypothetical protein [Flavobacteriales bacterium]